MDTVHEASKVRRHIQDHDSAESVVPHWGYADRVVPCTNDPGSCAYLDAVYSEHDLGMIFTGAFWLTIAAVFIVWGAVHWTSKKRKQERRNAMQSAEQGKAVTTEGTMGRLERASKSWVRRHLLPEAFFPFGRASRLQVLILGVLTAYLTIYSFVGITYKTWVTPVDDMPGVYNTRTGLGPWSDRVGVLAYALTPLSVLLSTRESFLSMITGVPYQNFNFLHRWVGYIIVVQSSLHTIGWCIIEIRLYQPQPDVAEGWIKQLYMIWGVVAMILLLLLYVLSLPPVIRLTGYEFFRKSHYVLALVYIGACIGHWEQLHCFLTPSIIIWGLDRAARAWRSWALHSNTASKSWITPAKADPRLFINEVDGDILRLDFDLRSDPWHVGQHFYLTFTDGSIWQSHPMTPLNRPRSVNGVVTHSYVFRAKGGETKKIADHVKKQLAAVPAEDKSGGGDLRALNTVGVVLTGPYGSCLSDELTPRSNVLCVAGGTGITYVLPVLLDLVDSGLEGRKVELIWVMRRASDIEWVEPELKALKRNPGILLNVFVTREEGVDRLGSGSSSEDVIEKEVGQTRRAGARVSFIGGQDRAPEFRHPDLHKSVTDFVEDTSTGPTVVFGSGPVGMITDLRKVVSELNSADKVWKGEERYDVALCYDERLER